MCRFQGLSVNRALTTLWLRCNNPGVFVVLTILIMIRASAGIDGMLALSASLETNSTLTELDLSGCCLEGPAALPAMKALSKALPPNNSLLRLNLSHNKLGDEAADELSRGVGTNKSLLELSVCGCDLGAIGVAQVTLTLSLSPTLHSASFTRHRTL